MLVFYVYKNKKVCNPYRIADFKYLWYEIIFFLTRTYYLAPPQNMTKVQGDNKTFTAVFKDSDGNYLKEGTVITIPAMIIPALSKIFRASLSFRIIPIEPNVYLTNTVTQ